VTDSDNVEQTAQYGRQVVCTIAEGRYFYGVAALANSLARAGFTGTIVVGYRGEPPRWLGALRRVPQSDETFEVSSSVRLQLVPVGGDWHLNNCKPHFIRKVLFELYRDADLVYYFDTDIVIRGRWETFASWAQHGVVTALDVADTYMPPDHVYRHVWRALAARQGLPHRAFNGYVNGGCVGISRAHADFATVWSSLMEELERDGADMRKMKNATGKLEFARMDQDVLNATIMATATPIALLSTESMGTFPWVGEVMPHAMWHRKPWDRRYIVDALRGFPPGRVHQAYWTFVDGPIHPFGRFELLSKRAQLKLGHYVGLVHTRSFRDL
jgi:hypothetical protein